MKEFYGKFLNFYIKKDRKRLKVDKIIKEIPYLYTNTFMFTNDNTRSCDDADAIFWNLKHAMVYFSLLVKLVPYLENGKTVPRERDR